MTIVDWFVLQHRSDITAGEWWTRLWVYELTRRLEEDNNPDSWKEIITEFQADLNGRIIRCAVGPRTASHLQFALDLVETVNLIDEHRRLAPGYLIQVALTEEESVLTPHVSFGPPVCNVPRGIKVPKGRRPRRDLLGRRRKVPMDGRIPLANLPGEWIGVMMRRGQTGVVKALYQIAHDRESAAILHCVRGSRNLAEWHEAMCMQVFAHSRRAITSVSDFETSEHVHGDAPDPSDIESRCYPIARMLFTSEELKSLFRDEAYAAEQFAHLYTAVMGGCHLQERLDNLVVQANEARGGFLMMRTQLRAMRGRYKVPPYLVPELDGLLKAAEAQASAAERGESHSHQEQPR